MLSHLKTAFALEGVDITKIPLTMDSGLCLNLRDVCISLGFTKIIIAGKE